MGPECIKKMLPLSFLIHGGVLWQRWDVALSGWWGWRGLSLGRFAGDSVSASHQ